LQAIEDLVARLPGAFRVAVGTQPRRRLWQHGQQGRFGGGQPLRGFSEVGAAGCLDPFNDPAHWRKAQVDFENLSFREVQFELQRACDLA